MRVLRSWLPRLFPVVTALLFAAFICAHGVPMLRHDWAWAPDASAFRANLVDSASGWSNYGFGAARPYPTDYIIDAVLYPLAWVMPPILLLVLLSVFCAYIMAIGADSLVRSFGARSVYLRLGVMLVATFNPWVYTEVVAGHLIMTLACGGWMLLLGRLVARRWDDRRDFVIALLIFPQIQFFLPVLGVALTVFVWQRAWRSTITAVLAFLPVGLGVLMEYHTLSSTPYFLSWQLSQSVDPLSAVQLSGYFTGYSTSLGMLMQAALVGLVALLVLSAWNGVRTRRWIAAAVLAALVVIVVSGEKGPLSSAYAPIVQHIPASGVYRELYDLVGFLCVCYVAMLASLDKIRLACIAISVIGGIMLLSWIAAPPDRFWVSSEKVPVARIDAKAGTRFALFPAFQPLTLVGVGGSGPDPDEWLHALGVAPLNSYLPSYPADEALAKYAEFGNDEDLAALGVSQIVCRPYLKSLGDALSAVDMPVEPSRPCRPRSLNPLPRVGISSPPGIATTFTPLTSGNILLGDLIGGQIPAPPSQLFDPESGWVALRLVERERPSLAEPYGGVYTRSKATLHVRAGLWILASGDLSDARGVFLRAGTGQYRWGLHRFGPTIECVSTECAVALIENRRPPAPTAYQHRWAAIPFKQWSPWLLRLDVPAGGPQQIQYNERFDRAWLGWADGSALRHYRLNGVMNGWALPPRNHPMTVWLVESVALVQAAAEVLALLWVITLGASGLRSFREIG